MNLTLIWINISLDQSGGGASESDSEIIRDGGSLAEGEL